MKAMSGAKRKDAVIRVCGKPVRNESLEHGVPTTESTFNIVSVHACMRACVF